MKKALLPLILFGIYSVTACTESEKPPAASEEVALDTYEKRLSYSTAYVIYRDLKGKKMDLDVEAFYAGLDDAFSGAEPKMTVDEMKEVGDRFLKELEERRPKFEIGKVGTVDLGPAKAFLAEHSLEADVVTLASGLQYKILEHTEGQSPTLEDSVVVNYRGTLMDGTEFDSSYATGKPATFPLAGVIKGWQEALSLMAVGSKWEIVLPPELGYGRAGSGDNIPPYAVLIFEIELVDIVEATEG